MKTVKKRVARGFVAIAFLSAMLGGTALLYQRAAASQAASRYQSRPMPVETLNVEQSKAYEIIDHFIGRLEPARQAKLSFEHDGLLTIVLVEEGERVNAGAVLATLDTSLLEANLERHSAQKARILADLELSRRTEKRQRSLQQKGHASAQKLDQARFGTKALMASLAAVKAEIRRVQIEIGKSTLLAPFSGIIGARYLDNGTTVAAGAGVLELMESARPRARVGLPPDAANGLKAGDPVTLQSRGRALSGKVYAVRPDLTTSTRTVGVLIDVMDAPPVVFGDTVRLEVRRQVVSEGYWLPVSALAEGEKGLWTVFTLRSDGDSVFQVGRESVELLHVADDRAYVRGTIRTGQRVISDGINRIVVGQSVILGAEGA
jgi:RND family efflux transporter MFP subunit